MVVGKISTDKMVYEVGETVTVIYSIENHGNKEYIPVLNGPCLFDFNYEVFSIASLSAVADGKLTYTGGIMDGNYCSALDRNSSGVYASISFDAIFSKVLSRLMRVVLPIDKAVASVIASKGSKRNFIWSLFARRRQISSGMIISNSVSIKKLVRVEELINPSVNDPIGIGVRGDELIIACYASIWAVKPETQITQIETQPQSTQRESKPRDSKPRDRAKVIGGCLKESEAGQLKEAIRGAESKGEVFDLYPQADRYGEELDMVLKFLGTGPVRYQKFGRFLEKERVYIKVISKDSGLFQDGNTGFIVEDENGNRREVYAFSMFNPEDNPDGSIYATIYIPEPVILKAKEHNFLEGFAIDLVHELVEIEEVRSRGLAGKILDGDMDSEAHRLAELAELDFGVIDGISTLDLFLMYVRGPAFAPDHRKAGPHIGSIKQTTEKAVARYRGKGLMEYTTMPEGLIPLTLTLSPEGRGQIGIILDSSLILNEIGMRECLEKLDKSRYIVWVMAKDEKEKQVLEKMRLPVQEVFITENLAQLIRRLKGKVGAGNVGAGLGPIESTKISEEIRRLAETERVPIVVPELPNEGQTVSTPMVITGILSAISNPSEEWIIVLPPIKLPDELWQKILDEYRCAVELELYA